MSTLRPGKEGDPLPCGTIVFRISESRNVNFVAMEERRALPGMFELSTPEKKSKHKRLSIWAEELTVADQAWDFMGKNPKHTVAACSDVGRIRAIEPPEGFERLDVVWERAKNRDDTPNERPGAEGHAGITNLYQGHERRDKEKRSELRSKIADAFDISPVPVPHEFADEDLRLEAYLHYERYRTEGDNPEMHWIHAVRQMRRAKVAEHRQKHNRGYQ
jgi:hypothetical protein